MRASTIPFADLSDDTREDLVTLRKRARADLDVLRYSINDIIPEARSQAVDRVAIESIVEYIQALERAFGVAP